MKGDKERAEASDLFRLAIRTASSIYSPGDLQVAYVYKEVAEHFEERHAEDGRPENSRWNRCAAIQENELSVEARQYYTEAMSIFIDKGNKNCTEVA